MFLSLDRFLAIRKPFLYQRLRKPYAIAALCITLIIQIGLTVPFTLIFGRIVFYVGSVLVVLGGFFILVSNALLYRSAKRQCEEISKTIVDPSVKIQRQKRNDMRKRKLKSLKICIYITASYLLTCKWAPGQKICIYITASYLLTWCPLAIYLIFDVAFKLNNNLVFVIVQLIGFSNGIWDVLIYSRINNKPKNKISQMSSDRTERSNMNETNV